ncbi:MAG: polyamine aminopropyltransferase [Nanoarchaeota archaeon]|jgi:spermidine synthase|nr:polyamine aminopropyltransferase [Nanoarchaeota archaeon]|tara:strand:- start:31715 stop:32578 length:864 start_codon:yes stop_codon:yes gene_type:complete
MPEIKEYHSKTRGFFIKAEKLLETQSKFQKIGLFKHDFYGKILRLDNYFQLSEFDEFLYHEPLIHFPLFSHPSPKKVLLIGGGDFCSVREILKHPIEKITQIELDPDVVKISKEHLKNINKESFKDPKLNLIIQDGYEYLKTTKEKFDVIILDLTDAVGESRKLYTQEFYELVSIRLNEKGILSLHIEQPLTYPKIFSRIYNTLKSVFKYLELHSIFVPIYGTLISFGLCSQNLDFKEINVEKTLPDLKYFSPEVFKSALVTPQYLVDLTNLDKRIITQQEPLEDLT